MNKILTAMIVSTALTTPVLAMAEGEQYYIEARAGYNNPTDEDDAEDTAAYGAAVGLKTDYNARFEIEATHRNNDYPSVLAPGITGSGDESVTAVMLNANYDIETGTNFVPYIGAGVGAARVAIDSTYTDGVDTVTSDDSDIVFAYQIGAGTAYKITEQVAATIGYRYLGTTTATVDADVSGTPAEAEGKYKAHEVLAGIRYSF